MRLIIKGNQRANGRELALHLLNVEDNEHAVVHELRGFLADDLIGAFAETEAISLGTQCQQYLFSVSLNPPKTTKVSVAEFERVIADIEHRFGLTIQPRAVVFHEKKGRRHAHCVWSRIDVAKMRAINLPHTKRGLMDISRQLYLEHGWDMPAGLQRAEDHSPNNFSHAEAGQAKRIKRDPQKLKTLFKACWERSDSRAALTAALAEHGFVLARGDRRGFVAVDRFGEVYSLSRWCGVKARDVRAKLGPPDGLPNVEQALRQFEHAAQTYFPETSSNASRSDDFEREKTLLVAQQREERAALETKQTDRKARRTKSRQKRLPQGMASLWARVTGEYQKLCEALAAEADECANRDAEEFEALIQRHLTERRALDRQYAVLDSFDALRQELQQRDPQARYSVDPAQPLILPRELLPFSAEALRDDPALILDHISEKHAQFDRSGILRALSEFISDPFELSVACDKALRSQDLVALEHDRSIFTTRDYLTAETALLKTARELSALGHFRVRSRHIRKAVADETALLQNRFGASLSDEQVAAIEHVLEPQQLSCVVGLAGAGKSTMLSVARAAWERQGYQVFGAALSGKAADGLQASSGIASRTLASLEASWKAGYEPIEAGSILVIDEAGMVGTRQLGRVTEVLSQRGCKLVLVGDPDQLQPIEAGTPFRKIAHAVGTAQLTDIRRQRDDWQRRASVDLATGQVRKAMSAYQENGSVYETRSRDAAITQLVEDYLADRQAAPDSSRLALAHRRKDVHAINQGIKSALRQHGPAKAEYLVNTDHGPRAFAVGDRFLFTRNDHQKGVRNGMLGTVTDLGNHHLSVRLDAEDGKSARVVTFDPAQYTSFDHGYAVSIHRAQGATVDRSFVLSSKTLDHNLTYVALTRHRDQMRFYTAPEISREKQPIWAQDMFETRAKAPQRTR